MCHYLEFFLEMTRPKTHDECRLRSCCCCGGKLKPESGCKKITHVTTQMSEKIQQWAKPVQPICAELPTVPVLSMPGAADSVIISSTGP